MQTKDHIYLEMNLRWHNEITLFCCPYAKTLCIWVNVSYDIMLTYLLGQIDYIFIEIIKLCLD